MRTRARERTNKASQVHRGAKFGEKHVVAAEVNDKAIKKIELFVRIRQRLNENSILVIFFLF